MWMTQAQVEVSFGDQTVCMFFIKLIHSVAHRTDAIY